MKPQNCTLTKLKQKYLTMHVTKWQASYYMPIYSFGKIKGLECMNFILTFIV